MEHINHGLCWLIEYNATYYILFYAGRKCYPECCIAFFSIRSTDFSMLSKFIRPIRFTTKEQITIRTIIKLFLSTTNFVSVPHCIFISLYAKHITALLKLKRKQAKIVSIERLLAAVCDVELYRLWWRWYLQEAFPRLVVVGLDLHAEGRSGHAATSYNPKRRTSYEQTLE